LEGEIDLDAFENEDFIRDALYDLIKNRYSNKVIYFDDFTDTMPSVITIDDLSSRKNQVINGFLKVSGLYGFEDKLFTDDLKARKIFEQSQEKLSKVIKKAWVQGSHDDIKIKITKSFTNNQLLIDVEDRNTIVNVNARSRGFKWFFSFYLKYRAYSDGDLSNTLFLLDEPGLFLHPKGQKDLLNYLEHLGLHNQVVYTTHSPFMINRLRPNRVRVIEKKKKEGTCVNNKGYSSNWRPLRTALGLGLSDSFYFADKTLLVEGPEDKLYILSLLRFFDRVKNLDLDLNLLSIMQAGGAPEMPALARILLNEDRPLSILIDSDSTKHLNKLNKIERVTELAEIKQINSFSDTAISIQDLLPKDLYENSINNYINELKTSGLLKENKTKSGQFSIGDAKSSLDKLVELYVFENFGEESVSKVGIAREFEIILDKKENMDETFGNCWNLIEWIIKSLFLSSK
jgi:predicted ATP-dependent endonuclease of OLD family